MRQARNITACQRIEIDGDHDDRNESARARDRLQCGFRANGDDQVGLRARQLRRDDEGAAWIVHPLIVDGYISTFAKAKLFQLRAEGLIVGNRRRVVERGTEHAKPNELARLLRARRERPRRRATKQRDEVAPFYLTEMHPIPLRAGSTSQDTGLQRISQRVCERFTTSSSTRPVGRRRFPQRGLVNVRFAPKATECCVAAKRRCVPLPDSCGAAKTLAHNLVGQAEATWRL